MTNHIQKIREALEAIVIAPHTHSARELGREALTHLSALEKEEWLPIESAPRDGTPILLYYTHGGDEKCINIARWVRKNCGQGQVEEYFAGMGGGYSINRPINWRPLPAPPINAALKERNEG